MVLTPGVMLGDRYQVIRLLGGGAMKQVYLVRDHRIARECALAEMIDRFAASNQKKAAILAFHREADLLAELENEHIPRIFDRFDENDRHYLVMEYVAGRTLEETLSSAGGRLDEGLVLDITNQILDTLIYLHTLDPPIIYRDLKPSNVILRDDGHLKMLDFGIARHFGLSRASTTLGTEGYSPPEQYAGRIESRSDLYALAATMHQLLSGRDPTFEPPFSFPPILQFRPELDPGLADLIQTALAYNIDERIADAREFKYRLNQIRRRFRPQTGLTSHSKTSPLQRPLDGLASGISDRSQEWEPQAAPASGPSDPPTNRHSPQIILGDATNSDECYLYSFQKSARSPWLKSAALVVTSIVALLCVHLFVPSQHFDGLPNIFYRSLGHSVTTDARPSNRDPSIAGAESLAKRVENISTPVGQRASQAPAASGVGASPSVSPQPAAINSREPVLSEAVLKKFRGCWHTRNIFQFVDSNTSIGNSTSSRTRSEALNLCWSRAANGKTQFSPPADVDTRRIIDYKNEGIISQWSDWLILGTGSQDSSIQFVEMTSQTLSSGTTQELTAEYHCHPEGLKLACSRTATGTLNDQPWIKISSHFYLRNTRQTRVPRIYLVRAQPRKYASRRQRFWPWLVSLVHGERIF